MRLSVNPVGAMLTGFFCERQPPFSLPLPGAGARQGMSCRTVRHTSDLRYKDLNVLYCQTNENEI
ncbi:MAG: hypothetical protein A4E62_02613 [Syntrophorhabdus sp. PtaU1.Bin002]|nr:MAG: hypothetical protein A4E62_02613 [Syntrophorhabdus sp. PtaU1.Bin002]